MKNYLALLITVVCILCATQTWFTSSLLTGGDLLYQSQQMYENFSLMPYAWHMQRGEGLGGVYIPFLWNNLITTIPISILGGYLHIPWNWLEKILFFYPFLILSFFSSYHLARRLIPHSPIVFFAPLVFILNSYILMLVSGGQMQIALAYALAPFIIGKYIDSFSVFLKKKEVDLKSLLVLGLLLSLQIAIDTRVVFITLIAVALYIVLFADYKEFKKNILNQIRQYLFFFIPPFIVILLLHAFWIIPLILYGRNPVEQLGVAYSSVDAVKFFSFAKLENTLSLLHPNWPENIFGKTYFMKAEFLLLPLLAFASLLFAQKKEKSLVLYFCLLGLLGAFLAKGANDPLGSLYIWLFEYVPGFSLFRDPTKWYILVALSYSVLIPFSIYSLYNKLKTKKLYLHTIFLLLVLGWLVYLMKPALLGGIGGTLKPHNIPNDYVKLEQLLSSEKSFSRTFWMPTVERFGFYSLSHPQMSGQGTFVVSSASAVLDQLDNAKGERFLKESGVGYVIIPLDATAEIFVDDHRYDDQQFQKTVQRTASLSGLKKVDGFEKMVVFKTANHKDHFWTESSKLRLTYTATNPTSYTVHVSNAKKGDRIVFSEAFDRYWYAEIARTKEVLPSGKYHDRFNSFVLPTDGEYTLYVQFKPQEWVYAGVFVSLISLIIISSVLLRRKK